VRIGSYSVFYHTSADDLSGPYVPPGVNFKAENLETLYLGYIRWFTPDINLELALGYPPLAKVKGSGPRPSAPCPTTAGDFERSLDRADPAPGVQLPEREFAVPAIHRRGCQLHTFYDRDSTAAGNAASGGPRALL